MIKKIRVKDLEFARRLRNKNREHFFNKKKISKLDQLVWFTDLQLCKEYDFYIIYDNNFDPRRVGTISAHLSKSSMKLEVGNIIIDKKYRKKGYFREALASLLELYPQCKAFLKVIPSNKIAIKAYEAIGFKEKERTLWI